MLTVWERFIDIVTRAGAGMPIGAVDYEALDRSYAEQARQRAEDGAERARRAGLDAQPRTGVREQRSPRRSSPTPTTSKPTRS